MRPGAFARPTPRDDAAPADDTVILPGVADPATLAAAARADGSSVSADASPYGRDHADGLTKVHTLLKDSEHTQVLPRLPPPPAPWKPASPASSIPASSSPAPSSPAPSIPAPSIPSPTSPAPSSPPPERGNRGAAAADHTTVFARIAGHESSLPFAEETDAGPTEGAGPTKDAGPTADAEDTKDAGPTGDAEDTADGPSGRGAPDRAAEADPEPRTRHHRGVWVSLVVFWLLALGAGFICLASVGARATCTTSDKGLDCTNTGSGIAIVLAICVVVLVGILSVHAVDARDRAKVWLRDLGAGVVILAVVAYAGYLLIGTISG